MEYNVRTQAPESFRTACLVVPAVLDEKMTPGSRTVNAATSGIIEQAVEQGEIRNEGSVFKVLDPAGIPAERLIAVCVGSNRRLTEKQFLKWIDNVVDQLKATGAENAALLLSDLPVEHRDLLWQTKQAVERIEYRLYRFDEMKSEPKPQNLSVTRITFLVGTANQKKLADQGVRQGRAIADGVGLARDLGNLPGNVCTPTYLAKRARTLCRKLALKLTVLDESQMEKLKMGSLLSVSRGSREPARLIVMEYRGGGKKTAPVVLIGKGLTFDAGGISIKPAAKMDEMKFDMCGGASVFGTMLAAATMKLPVNLVGIVPSSENLPDGAANKPGDIVTSMSGKTIEILNTDAEGRLILCDAMTYAERFDPAVVIDIATLTGACVVALGAPASGLFSNHGALASRLLEAGETSADRAWQLPLWDDYQDQLKSNFADMANVGGRAAGAITAACFLARFAENLKWAHLDIAGTAWLEGGNKGGTGRPVPLLTQFLIDYCAKPMKA